jgi:hypothetical protein
VFVLDAESVQGDKLIVPSRVRAGVCDYSDDIWSGQVYLSLTDGRWKSVHVTGEWELDVCGPGRVVGRDKRPDDVIERGPQIVDGVADQNPEIILRHGLVCFDPQGSFGGFGVLANLDAPVLAEEGLDLRVQVRDVMFGAGNLQGCSV